MTRIRGRNGQTITIRDPHAYIALARRTVFVLSIAAAFVLGLIAGAVIR